MQRVYATPAVAAITVVAIVIFGVTLVHALFYAPEDTGAPIGVPEASTSAALIPPEQQPARLLIPSLDIDANVQYVGVNKKGDMGVPSNFTDVAWYQYGTVPGQVGSAVIDGHVDNGLGLPGVFKRLGDAKVGDDVYIVTKEGKKLHFKVVNIATYPYKSVPEDLIFNRKDGAWLNLITCEGNWIKNEKTYDERLIVFTKLVR